VARRIRSLGKKIFIFLNLLAVGGLLLSYLSTHISPASIPWLALFGIAYGALLIVNIAFIIFWLAVKKRFALLSALALLIGINHFMAYFQLIPSFHSFDEEDQVIRIVSQNVRLFGWYNWRENIQNRDDMMRNLELAEGDIYCFQEFFHNSGPGIFETKELAKLTLNAPYIHDAYTSQVGKDQHYGIATLSRYPMIAKGEIKFEREINNNTCIYSDLVVKKDTIRVYNAHLASIRFSDEHYQFLENLGEEGDSPEIEKGISILKKLTAAYRRRAIQVEKIKAHMNESPYPVILCGDFNDTPVSYTYQTLSEGLNDAFRVSGWGIGNTYIGAFPSFRIDYILHSEEFSSSAYNTLEEKVSDHHAITCLLKLNP
jgi:endonuclease/exonuclease/phosphatase family metal-dependent hydrolase